MGSKKVIHGQAGAFSGKAIELGGGMYAETVAAQLGADLAAGAAHGQFTLDGAGAAVIPIADNVIMIGVNPENGFPARVGLEAPEAEAAGSFKKGVPVKYKDSEPTWFTVGAGTTRSLYVLGTAAKKVDVVCLTTGA